MKRVACLAVAALLLLLAGAAVVWAVEPDPGDQAAPTAPRPIPDLHLSVSEVPGETSLRVPLARDGYLLYGLLTPYLSLGSSTTLGVPWQSDLMPGLRRDTDGLDDVRVGAGMSLPLSGRTQLYGEYRFLRGRLDGGGAGRTLLQREPDSSDFRAGFSIRLD